MIVKKIHKFKYSGDVYNLTVKDNHNYSCDGLLVSNCHSAKSYSINLTGKKCINADFRIGFTGTLHKDKGDNWNIQSVLGPKIANVESRELIDRGILSKIVIISLKIKYFQNDLGIISEHYRELKELNKRIRELEDEVDDNQDLTQIEILKSQRREFKKQIYREEVEFVKSSKKRNRALRWIFTHIKDGQNTLILTQWVEHLNDIENYIIDKFDDKYKVFSISGSVKTEQRECIRKVLEEEENMIIPATFGTMKQGVNMKRLHNLILASSMKSEITIPQAIGRGLRTHELKDGIVIWDIVDDMSCCGVKNYMIKHSKERNKLYEDQGFKVIEKELIANSF